MDDDRGGGSSNGGPMSADADAHVVERVRRGDVQAYGVLVERYERGLLAAVLPVVRDVHAAQDVVQDVFVQCYLKLSALRDGARFGAWLLKVGGRAAIRAAQRLRDARMRIAGLEDGNAAEQPAATLLDGDERERLLTLVRQLPAHERVAVTLRYFEGRGVHEIAQITGRPVGTVTKQLSRAVERLRDALLTNHTEQTPCRPTNKSRTT